MRTTKRFDETVIARFVRERRGTGILGDYQAWHKVTRGDPSSRGRSHILFIEGRQLDLLSDRERASLLFALLSLPYSVKDMRAQFPLSKEPCRHELWPYSSRAPSGEFCGTLSIAAELGIRHPRLVGVAEGDYWTMTTDILLTVVKPCGSIGLLAIAIKTAEEIEGRRTNEKLRIEQEYWIRRDVPWLLLTECQWDSRVVRTLERTMPFALGDKASPHDLLIAREQVISHPDLSETEQLRAIARGIGCMEHAQAALWQSIWRGDLPIDLTRGWRPHVPLRLVSDEEFRQYNPIACGRSAWTS